MDPIIVPVIILLLLLSGGDGSVPKGGFDLDPKEPDPIPPPSPDGLAPKPPAGLDPAPKPGNDGLVISNNCKTVTVGATWILDVAVPRLKELAEAGIGLPVYTVEQASRSLDAAVRTTIAETAGVACIDTVPWLDRYVKTHPLPMPQEGQTLEQYRTALKAWDAAWESTLKAWVQAHPQLSQKVLAPLYNLAGLAYVSANNIDLEYGSPGPVGWSGPDWGVTPADAEKLQALGYDLNPEVTLDFQAQYNIVRDYQTNGGWTTFGMALDDDNKMGWRTRQALADALAMTAPARSWPAIVHAALTG